MIGVISAVKIVKIRWGDRVVINQRTAGSRSESANKIVGAVNSSKTRRGENVVITQEGELIGVAAIRRISGI